MNTTEEQTTTEEASTVPETVNKDEHDAAIVYLQTQIADLTNALTLSRAKGIDDILGEKIQEIIVDNLPDIDGHIYEWMCNSEYVEEGELESHIESWMGNYSSDYIDIDGNSLLYTALHSMCNDGKNRVAELVNELIAGGRITLPTAPAPAVPTGLDQQTIYTALDQIRGGITTILAHMDANQPEVTE